MIVAISPDELAMRGKEFFSRSSGDLLVIEEEGNVLGALVSAEDYESLRQMKARRVVEAMDVLGEHMASVASPVELENLVRELDTHNS